MPPFRAELCPEVPPVTSRNIIGRHSVLSPHSGARASREPWV